MNVRLTLTVVVARVVQRVLRCLGRHGTHLPGQIARRLMPSFLATVQKPRHIIAVTGTNGKTTVCNMIADVLTRAGLPHAHNTFGSNLEEGVVSALLRTTTWRGRSKVDWAVLEVDEIASRTVFPALKPTWIGVTNLFRDSYKRNGHTDYIRTFLDRSVPHDACLVVNGDDLIASGVAPDTRHRVFVSVAPLSGETENRTTWINDALLCPRCLSRLTYTFQRYHHIGRAHCPACGLESPVPDYVVERISDDTLTLRVPGGAEVTYPLVLPRVPDVYNEAMAIALLTEAGVDVATQTRALATIKVTSSRYDDETIGTTRVITALGKEQNPVANSRAMAFAGSLTDQGTVVVVLLNQLDDNPLESENISWIYDADVEALNQPFIRTVAYAGPRRYDWLTRFLLAGFDEDKLMTRDNELELIDALELDGVDCFCLIVGIDTSQAKAAKAALVQRLRTRLVTSGGAANA